MHRYEGNTLFGLEKAYYWRKVKNFFEKIFLNPVIDDNKVIEKIPRKVCIPVVYQVPDTTVYITRCTQCHFSVTASSHEMALAVQLIFQSHSCPYKEES